MICYFIVIIQLFLFWSIIYFIGQAMIGIISFDAVFYISISHVDHLQSCFWVRWCGFCKWGLSGASPMEWAIECLIWRVMPYCCCDECYHWFNSIINHDDDDCWVGGLILFKKQCGCVIGFRLVWTTSLVLHS